MAMPHGLVWRNVRMHELHLGAALVCALCACSYASCVGSDGPCKALHFVADQFKIVQLTDLHLGESQSTDKATVKVRCAGSSVADAGFLVMNMFAYMHTLWWQCRHTNLACTPSVMLRLCAAGGAHSAQSRAECATRRAVR
jgi:hypothetical protein